MRNSTCLILLAIVLATSFLACEKDDSLPGSPGSSFTGTYSFSTFENVVFKKWIANGMEVAPSNQEKQEVFNEYDPSIEDLKLIFKYNFDLIAFIPSTGERDTVKFKLINGKVCLSPLDTPRSNDDYFPMFIYSNNTLFHYYSYFQIKRSNGISGYGTLHLEPNYNIVDSGLKYTRQNTSVNQLKAGEEILTAQFKTVFIKE